MLESAAQRSDRRKASGDMGKFFQVSDYPRSFALFLEMLV